MCILIYARLLWDSIAGVMFGLIHKPILFIYLQVQWPNFMGKISKVVVCGQTAVGKTAILEQLVNGDHVVGSVNALHIYQDYQWVITEIYAVGTYWPSIYF